MLSFPEMVRNTLTAGVAVLLLAACGSSSDGGAGGGSGERLRFIHLGDTGTGCEDGGQCRVSAVIEQVCAAKGCDFAVIAGDNIYEDGVDGIDDEQFQTKFEQPYANLDMPFYMALGNHDVSFIIGGDGGNQVRGDYQVDYTYREDTSGKWRMPFRYYNKEFPASASRPLLELFVLDSASMTRFVDGQDGDWRGDTFQEYVTEHHNFTHTTVRESNAVWKMAVAHHPYISNGIHGDAGEYERHNAIDICTFNLGLGIVISHSCSGEEYKQFLEETICDEVDFFLAGHDHEMQWLQPAESCGRTEHLISGAGAKTRSLPTPGRNPAFFESDEAYGFVWIELTRDRMTGEIYVIDTDGTPRETDDTGLAAPSFTRTVSR